MPSNFLDLQNTKGITVRGRFVRKLKLVPTITNLKKQGLVLQKKFPTPYDDYKGNNLSELVVEDDNHFEEEETTVGSKKITEVAEYIKTLEIEQRKLS